MTIEGRLRDGCAELNQPQAVENACMLCMRAKKGRTSLRGAGHGSARTEGAG